MRENFDPASVKALVFDVFGTVVDWRGSIIREGDSHWKRRGVVLDWARFADAWRRGYAPAMNRVRTGEIPWSNLDALHRSILDGLRVEFGIESLPEPDIDYLNRVWHRLDGWPDAVEGLTRIKSRRIIATLSNGNVALLTNMAKHAGLPWDCILSAELFRHYQPDQEVYTGAAALLGLDPVEVMLVAAHAGDLEAARTAGLRTGFVYRPGEFGPDQTPARPAEGTFDVMCDDFVALAAALG